MRQTRWFRWLAASLGVAVMLAPGWAWAAMPSLPLVVYGTASYQGGAPVGSGTVQGELDGQVSGTSAEVTEGVFGSVGLGGAASVIVDGSTANPDDTGLPVSLTVNGTAASVSVLGCWGADGAAVSPTPTSLTWQSGWVCRVSLTVPPPPAALAIVSRTLPGATVGVPYAASLAASGGTPPYTWSLASGALPPGLTLDGARGVITGVPTAAGLTPFTLEVTDSSADSATRPLVLLVASPGVSVTQTAATTVGSPPSAAQPVELRLPQGNGTGTEVSVVGFTGTVNLADYASNPEPASASQGITFNAAPGAFFDVSVNGGSGLTSAAASLSISQCAGAAPGETLYWFDGTAWQPVSPAATFGTPLAGCLTATLTSTSSPSLSELSGTAFAVGAPLTSPGGAAASGGGTPSAPLPSVAGASPASGPAVGGTTVAIRGLHLTGATAVHFGDAPATSFAVDSDTEITAVAPAGTGTVDIRVTTPYGTSTPTTEDRFTYLGPTPQSVPGTKTFSDVPPSYWAYNAIEALVAGGIVDGFPDGAFKPGEGVDRAAFVKMLVLTLGLTPRRMATPFRDVPPSAWYAPYVAAALAAKIVAGTSPHSFRPDAALTRQELALLLARALHLTRRTALAFKDDGAIAPWAKAAVAEVVAAGLMDGFPDGTFRPTAPATRADVAQVLDQLLREGRPKA